MHASYLFEAIKPSAFFVVFLSSTMFRSFSALYLKSGKSSRGQVLTPVKYQEVSSFSEHHINELWTVGIKAVIFKSFNFHLIENSGKY